MITIDIRYPRPYTEQVRAEYTATENGTTRPSSFIEWEQLATSDKVERVGGFYTYYHIQCKFIKQAE